MSILFQLIAQLYIQQTFVGQIREKYREKQFTMCVMLFMRAVQRRHVMLLGSLLVLLVKCYSVKPTERDLERYIVSLKSDH